MSTHRPPKQHEISDLDQLSTALGRIHRAITQTDSFDDTLLNILSELLTCYQAERVWLLGPDRPKPKLAETKREVTQPGIKKLSSATALNNLVQKMPELYTTPQPHILYSNSEPWFADSELSQCYGVKTQVSVPIQNEEPWLLGMHFSSEARIFNSFELTFFQEVSQRICELLAFTFIHSPHNNEVKFKTLIETTSQGIISQDINGKITDINLAAERLLGVEATDLTSLTVPGYWGSPIYENSTAIPPQEHPALRCLASDQPVNNMQMGVFNPRTKTYKWLIVNSAPLPRSNLSEPRQVVSTLTDITELKQANTAITIHLDHLKSMEKISRITQQSESIDNMLSQVLDEMLSIFNCDRAWFLYPCDPSTPSWHVPMQRTRPQWPGAENNLIFKTSPAIRRLFSSLLQGSRTCHVSDCINNTDITCDEDMEKYHIKTQMLMTLFPKTDKPWVLGIHYCESMYQITNEHKHLFEEIGHHITHSLTTLISLKNLRESEERFRTLVEHAPEAIFVLDVDTGCFTDVNENAIKLFGRSREELLNKNCMSMSPQYQPDGTLSEETGYLFIEKSVMGETPVFEWTIEQPSGQLILCEVRLVRLPASEKTLVRGSMTNITERKLAEAQMHKLSSALEQTADAVMITDTNGNIEYVNTAFTKVTGYSASESIGKTPRILCSGEHEKGFYKRLWQIVKSGNVFNDVMINRRKDGSLYYEEKSITPLINPQGEVTHLISTGRDITERMETQERLHYLAHHDILTRLPNRALFMDRLDHAVGEAGRLNKTVAILFFDLDNFKMINDTLGHDTGDAALRIVAKLLKQSLHPTDTVARFGGDEFAIIIESITDTREITQTVQNIFRVLSEPVYINGYEIFLATSIGITLFPNDGLDATTLIKNADIAMYRAKEMGRNTYEFYSTEMSTKVYERLSLETKLRHALERQEFILYYQPLVEISTGKIIAAETLIRWQPPGENLIGPSSFISVLEETRLINPVGDWVLMSACKQLKKWNQLLPIPLSLSINLSIKQFSTQLVEETLTQIVNDLCLDPKLIELEITESLLVDSNPQTVDLLHRINQMGFRLSIDDFGTGYSSLSYLKRLPINTLKIDRSFVQDIETSPDDTAIINAIIAMAQSLKLNIIAEGVETQEQLNFLKTRECNIAQGYYFYKPMSAQSFERLILKELCTDTRYPSDVSLKH